jgi:hypothetical protein
MNNIRNHVVFGKNIYTWSGRSRKPGGGGVLNIIQGQGADNQEFPAYRNTRSPYPPGCGSVPCPFSFCK